MKPRIVVLDGHTLNPGDLDWAPLRALGSCTVYERTSTALVVERARNAALVLTNKVVLDRPVISQLPDLRYIGVMATGYNVVDAPAARERGITVTNVPGYGTPAVAQTTWALLLELTHHVGAHALSVRDGEWSRSSDFCYWKQPLVELQGLTLGLVGYGHIGRTVARMAGAFGMRVLVHTPHPDPQDAAVCYTGLEDVFRESDAVSLHCPLTAATRGLISAKTLALMKPTAFLINTARGGLVDEASLASALNQGRIAGAAVDVLSSEPPSPKNPLLSARNCIITPHYGWATQAARQRLLTVLVSNIRDFLGGTPANVVG